MYWNLICMAVPGSDRDEGYWLLEGYKDYKSYDAAGDDPLVEHEGTTMFDVLNKAFPDLDQNNFQLHVLPHQTCRLGLMQWGDDENPITQLENQTLVRVELEPFVYENEDGEPLHWDWYMNPHETDPAQQPFQRLEWVLKYVFGLPEDLPVAQKAAA
jgi:hypothetical protein